MNNNFITMKKILPIFILSLTILSCTKTQFEDRVKNTGSIDVSNYVSVGNSLTQGFQDNGLYAETQAWSYPALIAQQMKLANPNMPDFKQPMAIGNGSGYMHLEFIDNEITPIRPDDPTYGGPYREDPTWPDWQDYVKGPKYNNLGIAGIQLRNAIGLDNNQRIYNHVFLDGISTLNIQGNPYARFLDWGDSPLLFGTPKEYVDHMRESNATFFTNWLGNNDVLGYATSGGDEGEFTIPFVGTFKASELTPVAEFRQKYDSVLSALTVNGAKGVCATIPDVTSIPLFNTVTLESLGKDIWIYENDGSTKRLAEEGDLILLTALTEIEDNGKGTENDPLPHTLVLDKAEAKRAQDHTILLNNEIKGLAAKYGVPVVDTYEILKTFESGMKMSGIDLNIKYVEGGLFSLDGVHPNPKGYAIVANEFIKVINQSYGANIPLIDITRYRSVIFPN